MPNYLFPFLITAISRFVVFISHYLATASIGHWEIAEACLGVVVALACAGEGFAEFSKTKKLTEPQKKQIAKLSLYVLIVALLFEVPCLAMIDFLSSKLIDSSASQASAAEQSAKNAKLVAQQTQAKVDDTVKTLNVEELVLRYRTGDDAKAKDELLHIYATGSKSERQEIVTLAPELVKVAASEPVPAGICATPSSSGFQELIASQSAETRKATLRDCASLIAAGPLAEANGNMELRSTAFVHSLVPKLLTIAFGDQNRSVRDEATRTLQQVFANINASVAENAISSDKNDLTSLWNSYGKNYDALALLSSANAYLSRNKANYDSASLYDLLQPYEGYPSKEVSQKFASLRNEMRSAVEQRDSGPITDFIYHYVNNCPDVGNYLADRMRTPPPAHFVLEPESEDGDDINFQGLRYLASTKAACPAYESLVPIVAEFGLSTPQLSRRYAAIVVLNHWTDSSLSDPLDLKGLTNWWNAHKDKYPTKYVPQPSPCPQCSG